MIFMPSIFSYENMNLGQRCRHSEWSRTIAPGSSTEFILSNVEGLRVTYNTVDLRWAVKKMIHTDGKKHR